MGETCGQAMAVTVDSYLVKLTEKSNMLSSNVAMKIIYGLKIFVDHTLNQSVEKNGGITVFLYVVYP